MRIKKIDWSEVVFHLCNYTFMALVFVLMVTPFIHIISYSLSDASQIRPGILWFPRGLNLDAYKAMLQDTKIYRGLFISTARTVVGTALMVFVTSMAAYVLSRRDLAGGKGLRRFFVITMYFSSGIIPTFLLIKLLGLSGTFWVYVIPSAANVFNMILVKTYIEGLPFELEEAAAIDGASDFGRFFKVVLPLCVPVVATIALFSGLGQWNSFVDTQFYNAMNPELFPLQYVLFNAMQTITSVEAYRNLVEVTLTPQSLKMAMTVLTILPILLVYPFVQKHFMKGLLLGAIKG